MTATTMHTTRTDHRSHKAKAAHFLRRAAESFELTEFAAVSAAGEAEPEAGQTAGSNGVTNFTIGGAGSSR